MSHRPARIDSPEVVRELRNQVVTFDQKCRNALTGCTSDVQEVREWLRNDRLIQWKHQLRKREEEMLVAKRELAQAKWASSQGGRSVGLDEMRALERAKQRVEEAQRKIETVRKCSLLVEQKVTRMLGPVQSLLVLLDQKIPQATTRLDQMRESLEAYFQAPPAEAP